jgi:hypothetical protein
MLALQGATATGRFENKFGGGQGVSPSLTDALSFEVQELRSSHEPPADAASGVWLCCDGFSNPLPPYYFSLSYMKATNCSVYLPRNASIDPVNSSRLIQFPCTPP